MSAAINIVEKGQGDAVVLISGLGGLASFWEPSVAALSQSWRVITFDHPGVGGSEIDGLPNIPGIVAAALRVFDELELDRAHVVGHSTGSLVAQALALDHGPRVRSLALSSGWARPDKRFEDFFAYRKYVLAWLGGTAYNALTRFAGYPSAWYGEQFAIDGAVNFDEPSPLDVGMTQARMDMLLGYSRRDELGAVQAPTLVVGAPDDYIIPFHHSEELASLIPRARLLALNGGHFAPLTRTDLYTAILAEFWESLA